MKSLKGDLTHPLNVTNDKQKSFQESGYFSLELVQKTSLGVVEICSTTVSVLYDLFSVILFC